MTRIHRDYVLNLKVVESHQKLRPQRTIVDVLCSQEKRPQKLEHHVVQFHAVTYHVGQFLHDFSLSSHLEISIIKISILTINVPNFLLKRRASRGYLRRRHEEQTVEISVIEENLLFLYDVFAEKR